MVKFVEKMFGNTVFYSLITLLLAWNIWSLLYSPVVWYDEVFMASMTNSLLNGNGFALDIESGQQIFMYGPVYFLLTAFSFLISSVNAFSFRIVNLIFAFLAVFTVYRILGKLKINELIKRLIVLVFLIDVIFIANSHSGRMEFVAVYFTLLCLFYYLKEKLITIDYCFIALFASLAFLTTPRVAVILFPILIFVLIRLFKEKKWYNIILFLTIPIVSYLIWIFASYGSIIAWIDYYTAVTDKSGLSKVGLFLGGTFFIPQFQYPLLGGVLIAVVAKLRKKEFKITILFFMPILMYYLLVKTDNAIYTAFILSFLYIFLAMGLEASHHSKRIYKTSFYAIVSLCFFLNLGIFVIKAATIISTKEGRNQKVLNAWIVKNINPNSNVVGSVCYYYACINNNCSLRLPHANSFYSIEKKPEYLMISKTALNDIRFKRAIEIFKSDFDLDFIASFTPEIEDNILLRTLMRVGYKTDSSYSGDLYAVKLKSD
jgi:4-amino-4-deoxy-L-arabinose transferase-like glycosyltransferase